MNVVGYVRVSREEQERSGLGLEAQRAAITEACEQHGWNLVAVEQDVASGKSRNGRDGLARAQALTRRVRGHGRKADAIVVARMDRVAREISDFGDLVRSTEVICLSPFVNTTDPAHKALAGMLAVFAEWERQLIRQRTSAALMAKKAQGWNPPQHRPRHLDAKLVKRVRALEKEGKGLRATVRALQEEGFTGVRHPKQVARIRAYASDRR